MPPGDALRGKAPVERFAPSPTGLLHLGHAFSAITAHDAARAGGGRFLVRIEDLDAGRAREAFVEAIFRDMAWLGLRWETPVMRQSARAVAYRDALDRLAARGLLYPCVCTRADIAAAAAPQEGDAPAVYPGTCRGAAVDLSRPAALRLDLAAALAAAPKGLAVDEIGAGPRGETGRLPLDPAALLRTLGDVVLARKDGFAAYHLAVVVDDAAQGVTCVTRGEDLFEAAPLHRLLQALLDVAPPVWRHHRLIRDETGRRLAKRDDARSLASLRDAGATPAEIRARLGLPVD